MRGIAITCCKCDGALDRSSFNHADAIRVRPFLVGYPLDGPTVIVAKCECCGAEFAVSVEDGGDFYEVLGEVAPWRPAVEF